MVHDRTRINVFFYYFKPEYDVFWAALKTAESEENNPEQLWNSSASDKKICETALNRADYYLHKTSDSRFPGKDFQKNKSQFGHNGILSKIPEQVRSKFSWKNFRTKNEI